MAEFAVYAGLFGLSLVAATILPAQSEAALAGLLLAGTYSPALLLVAASLGNTAGSAINWALGRSIERYRRRRWFPVRPAMLERAQGWYRRYGKWSLLLSWLPVVGDPLTLVAGVMREPFLPFLLLVALAKAGRYLVVAVLALGWTGAG
ncbi:YqaA family protein [Roseomonas sp. E05]|uniref:YqaA family protein n=1 Tax=Roseomonas sp. E05 TaxID=3046310 RepID=UPI0024BA63E9|nr:YqaA family protein [Roseomonas sp. E05]MDJ0390631.1 YqaA family protein [Roseomonas sp. E05]